MPSLLAKNALLRAEVADVIERSHDLCWWAQQLVAGAVSPLPPGTLCGGAPDDDDAAAVLAIITRVALCEECIAGKSGVPAARVGALLTIIREAFVLSVETRPCTMCVEKKTTYGFDGRASPPDVGSRETARANGTKRAIVDFLAEHAGSAYCAACISDQLFNGKDIDVAIRHLEGAGLYRRHQRCSSCRRPRLVASLPAPN